MNPIQEFFEERRLEIDKMSKDKTLQKKSLEWMVHAYKYRYPYNYTWMGRPIIKFPNDMVLMQELIWQIQPDLIIETGIAHGGSIIFSASMLELIGKGKVVAVDIDIRKHNRQAIESHPMKKRITMYEGSSTDPKIFKKIANHAKKASKVMVFIDSLHTHDHVLDELRLYAPLVTQNSYIILADTFIEFFPKGFFKDRPWDVGQNPMTAIREYLKENKNFIIDTEVEKKLLITEGSNGYLKRVK